MARSSSASHSCAQPTPSFRTSAARAKPISGHARAFSRSVERTANGALLGEVLDAQRVSAAYAGENLGGERVVRQLRAGEVALTVDRLDKLPLGVQRAFYAAKLRALDGVPDDTVAPERASLVIASAHGELAANLLEALADGEIDAREARRLIPPSARLAKTCATLARWCARRARSTR